MLRARLQGHSVEHPVCTKFHGVSGDGRVYHYGGCKHVVGEVQRNAVVSSVAGAGFMCRSGRAICSSVRPAVRKYPGLDIGGEEARTRAVHSAAIAVLAEWEEVVTAVDGEEEEDAKPGDGSSLPPRRVGGNRGEGGEVEEYGSPLVVAGGVEGQVDGGSCRSSEKIETRSPGRSRHSGEGVDDRRRRSRR